MRAAPDSLTGQNAFNTSMKRMLVGLTLSSLCIYVRYAFAIAVSALALHTETACVQERISDDRAVQWLDGIHHPHTAVLQYVPN